jgi:hypothetical protein
MGCRPGRSAYQIAGQVEEAVAALDAAGDALADDGAGAGEAGDGRLAPWRVVRVDDAGRLATLATSPTQGLKVKPSRWVC